VENAIKEACDYITDIKLFDLYEGAQLGDKKSMAFSVVFTPRDEEFTQEKIDGFVENILKNLSDKYGATLRA
ncbi:MAG: hypothetical protein J5626_08435, partial [Lachnospiraceae bacterium]|nr:hypothetical protein [Lachnospiraceae bacterium]